MSIQREADMVLTRLSRGVAGFVDVEDLVG